LKTIELGEMLDAKHGRLRKWRIFQFQQQRHGKFYEQKRVEVIYKPEGNSLVMVTVYVFYGRWEEWT